MPDPDGVKAHKERGETLRGLMEEAGLRFSPGDTVYNSRMAQEFAAWARDQPGGEQVHDALYHAYFVEARNIGIIPVLKELAEELGYDAADAVDALKRRRLRDVINADWNDAMRTFNSWGASPGPRCSDSSTTSAQSRVQPESASRHVAKAKGASL